MEYTTEELAWAKSIIKPELPDYDEKDHEIAKMRFVMDSMFNDINHIAFLTDTWAQENMGASWLNKTHRRLYNWWWNVTGKKQWKFIPQDPPRTMEDIHKAIHDVLWTPDGETLMPDGSDQDVLDQYAERYNWDEYQRDHVEGWHVGDCTAFPASCGKCHAEQFYNFESPYEGKHKGHKALNIFIADRDEQAAEGEKS
jgi:hypothetical protein